MGCRTRRFPLALRQKRRFATSGFGPFPALGARGYLRAAEGVVLSLLMPSPCHVLIVEDDSSTRFALAKILAHAGYVTTVASTVAAALAKFDGHAAMILDLHLPDGMGVEVLRHLRRERSATRVAVCSAAIDRDLLDEVRGLRPELMLL